MNPAWIIAGVIAIAAILVFWLPMRKQWNADGEVDATRRRLDEEE